MTKMDLAENFDEFQPLPPALQIYAVLHHALAEGLQCDPGFHGNIHAAPWEHRNKVMCVIHWGAEGVSP